MKNHKVGRNLACFGVGGLAATLALVACSKTDTVPGGDTPGTTVTACGTLDATQAAELAATRLEHLGTVGLAALAGLENSRAAGRLLTSGEDHMMEPFVAESQSNLHDAIVKLREKQLVASNLESENGSTVTFLLRPESVCEDEPGSMPMPVATGGAGSTGGTSATGGATSTLDSNCVNEQTEHPVRVRVSRIACEQGDNVAVELLRGVQPERLALAELYAERAELEVNLGAFLRSSYEVTYSDNAQLNGTTVERSSERTEKPLVTDASGVLKGTLTLTGANQASGKVSITEAIDFTTNDNQPERVRLAAGNDVATIEADGTKRTIKLTAKLGAFDWRTEFSEFISGMFGLSLKSETTTEGPVDMHLAGLRGTLGFDGVKDVVVAEGLDLGGAAATAVQNGRTLLSVNASNAQQGPIGASFTGTADDRLGVLLAAGLTVDIQYGLEPVMSLIDGPANYLAKDQLEISATPAAVLSFLAETGADDLSVTSNQTGPLLRVEAGTVTMTSSLWPSDTVTAAGNQCLSRTPTTTPNGHDLLDDFVVGACAQ
ncbi:MAG TPA: hypothetical protein VIV60_27280 [Polyangiaceae bacterium]